MKYLLQALQHHAKLRAADPSRNGQPLTITELMDICATAADMEQEAVSTQQIIETFSKSEQIATSMAKVLLGAGSEQDTEIISAWLAESEENRKLYREFQGGGRDDS